MWVVVSAVVAITIAVSLGTMRSRSQQNGQPSSNKLENVGSDDPSKFVTADFDEPEPVDPEEREKRKLKNKRYDNQKFVRGNAHPDTGSVARTVETSLPLPIPVSESDVTVVGEIAEANAHVSNDKSGVYTEFDICISGMLKNNSPNKRIQVGKYITADRAGGFVRYPNGRKILYRFTDRNLPQVGGRYLLFLENDNASPNFKIFTGYEISQDKFVRLDREIQLGQYTKYNSSQFLQAVRDESAGVLPPTND
jgi:hypothetical protein